MTAFIHISVLQDFYLCTKNFCKYCYCCYICVFNRGYRECPWSRSHNFGITTGIISPHINLDIREHIVVVVVVVIVYLDS